MYIECQEAPRHARPVSVASRSTTVRSSAACRARRGSAGSGARQVSGTICHSSIEPADLLSRSRHATPAAHYRHHLASLFTA